MVLSGFIGFENNLNGNNSVKVSKDCHMVESVDLLTEGAFTNLVIMMQGTTETLLTKLEENLATSSSGGTTTLQDMEQQDMEEEGKDIEQVLSIISNSIYR